MGLSSIKGFIFLHVLLLAHVSYHASHISLEHHTVFSHLILEY